MSKPQPIPRPPEADDAEPADTPDVERIVRERIAHPGASEDWDEAFQQLKARRPASPAPAPR